MLMWDEIQERSGGAKAYEHGLNQWVVMSRYGNLLDSLAWDYSFGWAVTHLSMGSMPGHPDRRWPLKERLDPMTCFVDPEAKCLEQRKWGAHEETVSKSDLLLRAKSEVSGWKLKAIESLNPVQDSNDPSRGRSDVNRDDIRVVHMWVKDFDPSDSDEVEVDDWPGEEAGYNGAVLTVGAPTGDRSENSGTPEQTYIRTPIPWFGPRQGPYVYYGAYRRPNNPYPLSPLAATAQQARELNLHAHSMSVSAAQYKRIILVSNQNAKLKEVVASAPDNFVIPVDDDLFHKDQVVVVEVGGVTDQQLRHYEMLRERLNRLSGMSDAMRGDTSPDVSATADAIADSESDVRTAYLQNRFRQSVGEDLMGVLYYFAKEDRIKFSLGPEAGQQLMMVDPQFIGGGDETPEDHEIEVDAYSMQRTNEALLQKRVMEAVQLIVNMAPMMTTMPWLDWREIIRRIGDALNLPDLGDVVNFDMVQMMMQMGSQQMDAGGQQPQTMSGDGVARAGLTGGRGEGGGFSGTGGAGAVAPGAGGSVTASMFGGMHGAAVRQTG